MEDDAEITKRVFGIFVEQAQNVIRYSKDRIAEEELEPLPSAERRMDS